MSNDAGSSASYEQVDLWRFCDFCLRGEGNCNLVIGAREIQTGKRLVFECL